MRLPNHNSLIPFLLTLAPELARAPFYVLRCPPGHPGASRSTWAFAGQWDGFIRRYLIERGEWHGPGGIIALCQVPPDQETLIGRLLHEMAHLLPFRQPMADYDQSELELQSESQLVAAWAAAPEEEYIAKPWDCHESDFIRICLHLRHRAALRGVEIPFPALQVAGPHYRLSGAWKYSRLLGDEPDRMTDATFAEIAATPAPQKFEEQFQADCAAWMKSDAYQKVRKA